MSKASRQTAETAQTSDSRQTPETPSTLSTAEPNTLSTAEKRERLTEVMLADDPTGPLWEFVNNGWAEQIVPELPALVLEQDPLHTCLLYTSPSPRD